MSIPTKAEIEVRRADDAGRLARFREMMNVMPPAWMGGAERERLNAVRRSVVSPLLDWAAEMMERSHSDVTALAAEVERLQAVISERRTL